MQPPPTRLFRATAIVATVGVLVALLGLGLLLRPVRTPIQDCGTQIGFLLDGRANEYADPNNPPKGLTGEEVEAINANPCRSRVADKAKPAGVLLLVGVGSASGAALTEMGVRGLGWRRRRTAKNA